MSCNLTLVASIDDVFRVLRRVIRLQISLDLLDSPRLFLRILFGVVVLECHWLVIVHIQEKVGLSLAAGFFGFLPMDDGRADALKVGGIQSTHHYSTSSHHNHNDSVDGQSELRGSNGVARHLDKIVGGD